MGSVPRTRGDEPRRELSRVMRVTVPRTRGDEPMILLEN